MTLRYTALHVVWFGARNCDVLCMTCVSQIAHFTAHNAFVGSKELCCSCTSLSLRRAEERRFVFLVFSSISVCSACPREVATFCETAFSLSTLAVCSVRSIPLCCADRCRLTTDARSLLVCFQIDRLASSPHGPDILVRNLSTHTKDSPAQNMTARGRCFSH